MNWFNGVLTVARVEKTRLFRSRSSFALLLLVPAMQVFLFGYAIQPPKGSVRVAVAGPDSSITHQTLQLLGGEPTLQIAAGRLEPGGAAIAVLEHRAVIGVELPSQPAQAARLVIDGSNAALTEPAVARILANYWRGAAEQAAGIAMLPGMQVDRLYNPEARGDWAFLPSLIGVTVMISMILLGALSLAREREAGTWETLLTLPLSNFTLICGKLLPYMILGTLQGTLVLIAGIWIFALPANGSVASLLALLPLFAAAHFLLGYAISARAATQLEALQGAVAYYLPAMLLSGFLYPFEALPGWAQTIGKVFPLTHFISAARGVLLQGQGPAAVLVEAWPILIFTALVAAAGLLLQARRL